MIRMIMMLDFDDGDEELIKSVCGYLLAFSPLRTATRVLYGVHAIASSSRER